MGWPLGDPACEVDRHQAIRHSRDWCRLIAVVLHEAAVPVSASIDHSALRPCLPQVRRQAIQKLVVQHACYRRLGAHVHPW